MIKIVVLRGVVTGTVVIQGVVRVMKIVAPRDVVTGTAVVQGVVPVDLYVVRIVRQLVVRFPNWEFFEIDRDHCDILFYKT